MFFHTTERPIGIFNDFTYPIVIGDIQIEPNRHYNLPHDKFSYFFQLGDMGVNIMKSKITTASAKQLLCPHISKVCQKLQDTRINVPQYNPKRVYIFNDLPQFELMMPERITSAVGRMNLLSPGEGMDTKLPDQVILKEMEGAVSVYPPSRVDLSSGPIVTASMYLSNSFFKNSICTSFNEICMGPEARQLRNKNEFVTKCEGILAPRYI